MTRPYACPSRCVAALLWLLSTLAPLIAWGQSPSGEPLVRLKDLVQIRGVRPNALTGIGLIVGLPGTGDSRQSVATNKAAALLLSRLGSSILPSEALTRNVAIVALTADLPPFARIGDEIPWRASSLGDAASLEGGTLIAAPLSGADNQIYAVAQGPVSSGTALAGNQGGGGSSGGKSAAPKTVVNGLGGRVEREFEQSFLQDGAIELSLRSPDFTTAARIARSINDTWSAFLAEPQNAGRIRVQLPPSVAPGSPSLTPVAFVAALEQLAILPDFKAIVVLNERTGTVISGHNVTISPVALSHGGLEVLIEGPSRAASSRAVGQTGSVVTVGDLVRALNAFGAGPKDLVAIFQTLAAAHALQAELQLL